MVKKALPFLLITYVALLFIEKDYLRVLSISGQMNLLGLFVMLISFTLIVAFAKSFCPLQIVKYIGRKSIILYFFSGTFPALICQIAKHFFPETHYSITIIVAVIAFSLGLLSTWLINNSFHF